MFGLYIGLHIHIENHTGKVLKYLPCGAQLTTKHTNSPNWIIPVGENPFYPKFRWFFVYPQRENTLRTFIRFLKPHEIILNQHSTPIETIRKKTQFFNLKNHIRSSLESEISLKSTMISLFLLDSPEISPPKIHHHPAGFLGGRIPPWSERIPAQGPTSLACEAAGGVEKTPTNL